MRSSQNSPSTFIATDDSGDLAIHSTHPALDAFGKLMTSAPESGLKGIP
jgi:hypothetical protein